jgi:hypothetical protein
MVSCLAVNGPAASVVARLRYWTRRDWKRALAWLHTSGLALYFRHRLRELGVEEELPSEVRARLSRNHTTHCLRVAAMRNEFNRLNRCFTDAGIRFAALKGFSLVPEYCADATLRTQYDFDYLVAPESEARAGQALRAAAYVGSSGGNAGPSLFFPADRPPRIPANDDELYSLALPPRVEVHTRLWETGPEEVHAPALEDALHRAQIRNWQGLSFPALADEDALAFQVLHALRHVFANWCRLSIVLEIAPFLERRSNDEAFWERFCQRADACPGLAKAAAVMFSLSAGLFGARIAPSLGHWMAINLTPPLALWLERYGRDSALGNFMGEKFNLFLHREFIADATMWRSVRRRKLVPLHAPSRAARASSPGWGTWLSAALRQAVHVTCRLRFHSLSAVRYAWELPRWDRLRRRLLVEGAREERLLSPIRRHPIPAPPVNH